MTRSAFSFLVIAIGCLAVGAQEKSVKPGINDPFRDPDVKKYVGTFEGESREVFVQREKIVAACELKPGMVVADVGAGTGLFTRLLARAVGPDGQVFAADISPKFLEHIQSSCRKAGIRNVSPVLCNQDSVDLPADSIDLAFVSDTYHHFEFPERTLASLMRALKPGGRLVVIDFQRIPGKSSDWVLSHVRAGKEVVEKEVTVAGFTKIGEKKDLLNENYFIVFTKPAKGAAPAPNGQPAPVTPLVPGYGAVVPSPDATELPVRGTKVVFDVTAEAKDLNKPLPGLERVATLLNLAGTTGLKPTDLEVVVVLHGNATSAALDDDAYREVTGRPHPHAGLMKKLTANGVRLLVCGQSLARKGLDRNRVRSEVKVAASAVTAVANLQSRGFAYIPAH